MRAMSVVADLLLLNLLTVLCSVPVLTAGAAFTALYDRMIRMVRGEETYILKPFLQSFGSNLKKGSLLGIIFLIAAGLLYVDYRIVQLYLPILIPGVGALAVILLAVALYAFPLLARYENTLPGTLKNAALLMIGYFPRTLAMVVVMVGIWMAALQYVRIFAPMMLLLGLSLPCYVCVLLINGVFEKIH